MPEDSILVFISVNKKAQTEAWCLFKEIADEDLAFQKAMVY